MAKKLIGIDSCLGINYIGAISGFEGQIDYLYIENTTSLLTSGL